MMPPISQASPSFSSLSTARTPGPLLGEGERRREALLLSGMALGLVAGATLSALWWKQRARALNLLHNTPFERAEKLIANLEHKFDDIERDIEELKKQK